MKLIMFFLALSFSVHARESLWQQKPLSLDIGIGTETSVQFPFPVHVNVPSAVIDSLTVTSIGEMVYIKPKKRVSARLLITSRDGVTAYLMDVDANAVHAEFESVVQVIDHRFASKQQVAAKLAPPAAELSPPELTPEVTLIRFIATQFYGPERLQSTAPAARIAVSTAPLRLLIGSDEIIATPIAAWSYKGSYGIAIRLQNYGNSEYTWDPRKLRGTWRIAAAQHTLLTVRNSATNTHETTAYLITDEQPNVALAGIPQMGALQ